MITDLGIVCDVCQVRIHQGHWFIPYIPGGYGEWKGSPFSQLNEGHMHVAHLSSSDLLAAGKTKVQA